VRGRDPVVVLSGSLRYQACDDRVCLRPSTVPLRLGVRVSSFRPEKPGRRTPRASSTLYLIEHPMSQME
jgi:hypothetical protein